MAKKKTKEELVKELKDNDIDPGRTDDEGAIEHIAATSGISQVRPAKPVEKRTYNSVLLGLGTINDHEKRIADLEYELEKLKNART